MGAVTGKSIPKAKNQSVLMPLRPCQGRDEPIEQIEEPQKAVGAQRQPLYWALSGQQLPSFSVWDMRVADNIGVSENQPRIAARRALRLFLPGGQAR